MLYYSDNMTYFNAELSPHTYLLKCIFFMLWLLWKCESQIFSFFMDIYTYTLDGLNSSSKNFNPAWSMKASRTYRMFYFVCLIPPKPMDASSSKCQQIFLSWMVLIPYRWKYHSTWFFYQCRRIRLIRVVERVQKWTNRVELNHKCAN